MAAKQTAEQKYIAEIDHFALMLRNQQNEIDLLAKVADRAKCDYEHARDEVREAREREHNVVTLLLKFIRPGSIEIMPLFDQMAKADEKVQGKGSSEWRKETISALNLSALATRLLLAADVVLVGQLQDLVLKGNQWNEDFPEISDAMAQAIEAKLCEFIEEKSK